MCAMGGANCKEGRGVEIEEGSEYMVCIAENERCERGFIHSW